MLFAETVLDVKPQPWQARALRAVRDNDRIAIKSGHGVGKTAFLSWTVLWWLCTHYPCKVAVTANTAHQLSDVLWTEIDKWARKLPPFFKDQLDFKTDKIALKGATDSFAVARTSRKENPEALQGFHSENMLLSARKHQVSLTLCFRSARVLCPLLVLRPLCAATLLDRMVFSMRRSTALVSIGRL